MTDRTAYARVKRWRDRIRRNVCLVTLEIGEAELDTLISHGHLIEAESTDHFKIAAAVNRMITRNQRP